MQIETLSIVVGDRSCNARCPFCVSRMTAGNGVDLQPVPSLDRSRLDKALRYAERSGVNVLRLTGKGEPTLHLPRLLDLLQALARWSFPVVELQTNGLRELVDERWTEMRELGLTTVGVSVVHYEARRNQEIYLPEDGGLEARYDALFARLRRLGFTTRLSCVLLSGYIDSAQEIDRMIDWVKEHRIDQLTLTPVRSPPDSEDPRAAAWAEAHRVDEASLGRWLTANATQLLRLPTGATVFERRGQNVCWAPCMPEPDPERPRQLIYFPDGHLRYSWRHPGAILF